MLKVVQKKLSSTRTQIQKEWGRYRKAKKHLLGLKRISKDQKLQVIASERDLTRQRVSGKWTDYRERKYGLLHKSPYRGFYYTRMLTGMHREMDGEERFFRYHNTYQKIYKTRKNFDPDELDTIIPKILDESNVQGILLVFQIYSRETDTYQYVSNYITDVLYERIEESEKTIFEYVTELFVGYGDYELKFIYMRVIYKKQ
jgi:hypothetical protein